MQDVHPARMRLRGLIRQPESRLNLAEAALCIAWEDQRDGRPAEWLGELDALAEQARLRLAGLLQPRAIVLAFNSYLFGERGFRGNTWQYNDPVNSFLDRVLETHARLPITLSVVYLEVGWRLGLPVAGVALPGHFLVRFGLGSDAIFIDPFNRGRLWIHDQCETQIATFYGSVTRQMTDQIMVLVNFCCSFFALRERGKTNNYREDNEPPCRRLCWYPIRDCVTRVDDSINVIVSPGHLAAWSGFAPHIQRR